MNYYDLLMRGVLNRVLREMTDLPVWVAVSAQGVGGMSYRHQFDRGTLTYNYTDVIQFKIVPVPLDTHILALFGQLFYHGEPSSLKLHDLYYQIESGLKLLKEYPI